MTERTPQRSADALEEAGADHAVRVGVLDRKTPGQPTPKSLFGEQGGRAAESLQGLVALESPGGTAAQVVSMG